MEPFGRGAMAIRQEKPAFFRQVAKEPLTSGNQTNAREVAQEIAQDRARIYCVANFCGYYECKAPTRLQERGACDNEGRP